METIGTVLAAFVIALVLGGITVLMLYAYGPDFEVKWQIGGMTIHAFKNTSVSVRESDVKSGFEITF